MRGELTRLLEDRPRTVVLVTHDIEEAAQLADRIIVLTDRPARIRREISIHSPRPRDLTDSVVVDTTRRSVPASIPALPHRFKVGICMIFTGQMSWSMPLGIHDSCADKARAKD
jgi:energy-coupling factor transporter ATP-binding protein EcfA2